MSAPQDGELLIQLTNLQTKLERRLSGPLSFHGISFTEFLVLRHLHQAPGKRLRRVDLAQAVGLSASGVTRMLNPMHKTGLVDKAQAARDARVSLVALTDAGERVFRDADVSFQDVARSFLAPIDSEQREALLNITAFLL